MPDGRDILFDASVPTIRVGGEEKQSLARDLLELEVEESIEGLSHLRFCLSAIGAKRGERDEALLYLDGTIIDFGKEIEIQFGPSASPTTVFKGRISAIALTMDQGKEPEVKVMAEDRLMDLRMTRRFKTYEQADLSDIAQQIASQHGLSAQVDADSPRLAMVQQWNQTDLTFLREQAARVAAEIWVEDTTIHVADRDRRRASATKVTLIQGNDLLAIALRADLAEQRNSITVGGFDAQAKDTITEDSDGSLAAGEAQGKRNGPDILTSAFAERKSFRLRDVPLASADARSWSRAAMLRRVRRFVRAEGVTTGTPGLRSGVQVKLERVGSVFEGEGYHVTHSLHRYDLESGYRTMFQAERAGLGSGS